MSTESGQVERGSESPIDRESNGGRQSSFRTGLSKRGFTVLEILVIMAVVGILAAIGFYSLNTLRPIMAIRGVSTEISTMLQKARLDAIRNSRPVIGRVETEPGGPGSAHNPTGIKNEFLVFSVRDAFGVETEINSYRMFRGFPNIHFWSHDENQILDANSITFDSDRVVFTSDGTVSGPGAFRIAYRKLPVRNTLEIRIPTIAGIPEIRKYLLPADRPSTAPAQEFFIETIATSGTRRALWHWY